MFDRRAWGRAVRLLSWIGVFAALLCTSRAASAYPWMIRHEYQGCVPCHADPSGAGLLTEYGRAMAENIMRSRYGVPAPDEPSKVGRFLWGVPTPDWLLLGGSVRNGVQLNKGSGSPWNTRLLQMEADFKAQLTLSRFRAYGSIGYMHEGASLTQLTHRANDNLVSREHWIGVDLGEDKQFLLRAGRIDLPFGIRNDEHDLLVRSTGTTRTNINESQQHGVALNYNGSVVRAEIMALLGNYQLNPDAFRERGYAGYLEILVAKSTALGLSSMITYAKQDYQTQAPDTIRQVHGAFARFAPVEPLVLMIEANALITKAGQSAIATAGTMPGFVGMVQADIEPTQGLHLIFTGEAMASGGVVTSATSQSTTTKSFDAYAGVLWFFAPHADLRFDFVAASVQDSPVSFYLLPQLHFYL